MADNVLLCFGLIAITAACAVGSRRLGVPHSILLVVVGLALAFVPGLPRVALDPALVMLLFLPPLLYYAGVAMSWRAFCGDIRTITVQAVGCVIFTAAAVATVAHLALGMSWAAGFVLGAVVSPPDVIAPMAIARRLQIPRRILTILEGEGLVNDATALILFRFAVVAVVTGGFSIGDAAGGFLVIVIGEVIFGVAIGWLMLRVRRWVNDPDVEITLALLTPYLAFWPPELLGGSGVLAAVSAGLYVSRHGSPLISAGTRLQGFFIWRWVVYLIEGVLFLLTGLQARSIFMNLSDAAGTTLFLDGALITALVILVRFAWVFPGALLARALPGARAAPWQYTFAIAFTGIRGVVSLAAALSIPLTLGDGRVFPERDTILFITFCVILATLLGQGSMLPGVFRRLGLVERGRAEQREESAREYAARIDAVEATLGRLRELSTRADVDAELAAPLQVRHEDRLRRLRRHQATAGEDGVVRTGATLELELIAAERARLHQLRERNALADEARRRVERELDLEEVRILQAGENPG
ncbi:MAG: Na+/H+ antiporter [Gammaproteobacteria bacterium]|nr:Na+/H+ antiporter [Gammaproteobacteria bacterium]MDE2250145.1 Na+/H+ antiporter [Gammaproteobacteria bacterium]